MLDRDEIQHQFVAANGLRFHVASCGTGDRLALCLHGFPECWYSWRHQLPLLARLGYRAWAPDLRGYGESDRPLHREDYAVERLLDDVAGLIDAAQARSTIILAHDWGAIIAWYFALRQLRPLDRLVIMNVPHPAVMDRAIRRPRQMLRSWYVLLFQIPRLPEALLRARNHRAIGDAFRNSAVDKSRFPDDVLRVYRDHAARPGALTAMMNYYRALVRGGGAERQRQLGYPPIEIPTLMIWGERDVALGKETTYGTDAFVPNLTLRYLPNVSHWVQQEAPETVNAMLEAWLSGQTVPEAA
ncbi:MAG: alpha/beta hydrolase [Deltaproteobacteria bacterium]|nr:alpha/beta hydrolase [Deltaproteobacteria bacterium]MBI3386595.1 alpha/beta hydrolase [Deltaproteobacteria bacterium]